MAKRFAFKLASVLRVKVMREEEAKRDLAFARQAIAEQVRRIESLKMERSDNSLALMKARQNIVDMKFVSDLTAYILYLDNCVVHEEKRLVELRRVEEQKLAALVVAQQERRVLERLKEKKYLDYMLDLDREEQKIMDEIGNRQFFDRETHESPSK